MTQLVIRCTAVTLYTLQLDIRGLLKGYTATDYYYEYTKFVPYLLDDAVIGSVSCAPAKTNFDSGGLLPFIAAAASNTTVLAEGFASFLPTAAIEFHYENILTWKQVKDSLCAHGQKRVVDELGIITPALYCIIVTTLWNGSTKYSCMAICVYILQALRLLNKTVFYPRVDGLETLLMNMTDVYSDLVCALLRKCTCSVYLQFAVFSLHIATGSLLSA